MAKFNEKDSFEKSLEDINLQNQHGNDQGFYTGKTEPPIGLKNLYKKPVFLFICSILLLIPLLLETLTSGFSISILLNHIIPTLLGFILFIAGILRITK